MRPAQIEVEAVRPFRAHGQHVEVGARVALAFEDAMMVITLGRARAVGEAARHVGVQASAQWSEPTSEQTRGSRWMSGAAA